MQFGSTGRLHSHNLEKHTHHITILTCKRYSHLNSFSWTCYPCRKDTSKSAMKCREKKVWSLYLVTEAVVVHLDGRFRGRLMDLLAGRHGRNRTRFDTLLFRTRSASLAHWHRLNGLWRRRRLVVLSQGAGGHGRKPSPKGRRVFNVG